MNTNTSSRKETKHPEKQPVVPQAEVPISKDNPNLMSAETIVGDDVCNDFGDNLGKIKDIMLDLTTGKVGYVVLSCSTFLGMSEKYFAVPWNALKLDGKNKRFTMSVNKDELKNAPGFDKGKWPTIADQRWAANIHTTYQLNP